MNEYRFTGIHKKTGEAISDQMRAENELEVRERTAGQGIEIETVDLVPPIRTGPLATCLLTLGQWLSILGCAAPLVYLILVFGNSTQNGFRLGEFAAVLVGAVYSGAMVVVFSRVKRIAI